MDEKERTTDEVLQSPQSAGSGSRMTAEGAIIERIKRLRQEADHLEALLNVLPRTLPLDADEGLWKLVVGFRL